MQVPALERKRTPDSDRLLLGVAVAENGDAAILAVRVGDGSGNGMNAPAINTSQLRAIDMDPVRRTGAFGSSPHTGDYADFVPRVD